uniref:Maternal effect embryo arrest 22 n=2 Tax=Aegilops tauschii subsp. strangulata TaxID=200361 RepID=A0A453FLB3_AEGTS
GRCGSPRRAAQTLNPTLPTNHAGMAAETAENDSSQETPPLAATAGVAGGPNPCCAKLWKKYQQIEKGRAVLREAVKLLNSEIDKVRNEKSALAEVCKEERLRADSAEAARETESDARDILEKEVIELKAENSALHQKQNFGKNSDELLRISELEEENRRLKQVLGEEKLKSDSEKKKVEEAKSKALEAQKLLKSETHKYEEYKRLADTERKIANDLKASCEKLRTEVNETRAQLSAQIQKTGEAHKKAEAEKQKAAREKKCADSEKMLAEKNKKLIEVERKKAMEEKSHSNHLLAQLQEQKKLNESLQVSIEAQRKNAMSEKNRADHLLQKLEEERKRSECLQRKSDDLSATRDMVSLGKHGIQHIGVATESANIKLLKEKLKRKKDQLKHVKNESKLEKSLIRKEIELLKQDWMKPLNRFNMLDDYLAGGVEGIHAMKKLKRQQEVHDLEHTLRPRNPVAAPYFGLQAGIIPSTSAPREYTSYQLPRESCTRPISGTRKNQNLTGSELPPKDCNTRKQDRALLEISGHSSRRKALKSSLPGGTEVADQMPNGGRKRKRTKNSVESLPHDATANNYLAFGDDRSCPQEQNIIIPCINKEGSQNRSRKCHAAVDKSLSGCAKVLSPGAANACAGSKFASLLSFEKLIEGDCLKLLNLDNDADEEKYRKAMKRPLSPDVPIVLPTITRRPMSPHLVDGNDIQYDRDCSASRSDGSLSEVQKLSQNAKFQSSYSRTEYSGSVKELCANNKSNTADNDPYNTKLVDVSVTARSVNVSRGNVASNSLVSIAVDLENTMGPQFSESSCRDHANASLHSAPNKSRLNQMFDASSDPELRSNVGTSKSQVAGPVSLTSNSVIGRCHGAGNNTIDFVGVSSLKRSSLIKILRYWDALSSEAVKLSEDIYVDGPLLERVSAEPLLLPEERVPFIFSLLLWDVRKLTTEPVDQYLASSAFSMTVKPYMETILGLLKSNHLDVLVSLIEDFLVNKEVMVCDKMGVRNSVAIKYCHLDDETGIQVSTKPATVNQFISACILLASICVKVERLDVVLEVSYRVLQMGKLNLSWTMLALHVFGSVCGDKLRFLKSCNLLMTTVRLVVLLLESTDTSSCLVSSYIQSNRPTAFPSCTQCVFDVDTVSIDVFISSLLDELDLCALSWNNHANSNEAITRHSSHSGSSGLEINCGESCNISKQAKFTEDTNYPAERDLCYFTEIISLLELFGNYMSCEWTYKNVVVRLLKILESCTCEEYSAALLVLVSQLGRFFIDDVGYETEAVVELRNKLAVLIGTSFTRSRSIPVQFSAIGALLSLFPLTFDKIVSSQTGPLSGPCVLQASQISEWFGQLSKENQSFARSFFS